MSSDEEDGEEMNRSLEGFVVNNTHCSQGLNGGTFFMAVSKEKKEFIFFNESCCLLFDRLLVLPPSDSEMRCVYLKSVRSPVVQGKFKMSYRNHHNMDIFSQVGTYFILHFSEVFKNIF